MLNILNVYKFASSNQTEIVISRCIEIIRIMHLERTLQSNTHRTNEILTIFLKLNGEVGEELN